MQKIVLTELSMMEKCPECDSKFVKVFDKYSNSSEYVCEHCGIVRPTFDPYLGAEGYGRSPYSSCVYGEGNGTDIFSKSRGEDGSNSPSFDLHGGNGKYKHPVVSVMQPWDLLRVVEPNSKIQSMKEQYAGYALTRGVDETQLSNTFAPILAVAKKLHSDQEHFLVDADSHENGTTKDSVVFCTPSGMDQRLREFLRNLRDSLPEE
jgi:predicted RNA-binding Zn-ribbon protein involved in translation (DUF1610 family)